jgi:quercetin dioxygenase-like cupin family protein
MLAHQRRLLLFISIVLIVLALPAVSRAESHISTAAVQETAIFPVTEPPTTPFHAHQSMILFTPGAEAALHRHGGPGYITILGGELTLFEDGVENRYVAGDSLVEVPESLYKGGNYTETGMTLMVTYLVPNGEEVTIVVEDPDAPNPPEITPTPLAEAMHTFDDPPSSFDLIHTVSTFQPGASLPQTRTAGTTLLTGVSGATRVEIAGETRDLAAGDNVVIGAGQQYSIVNNGDEEAVTMATKLVSHGGDVLPATGSAPHHAEPLMWLMLMTAMSLLVIGVSLRLNWGRV